MNKKSIGAVLLAVAATLGGPIAVREAVEVVNRPAIVVEIDGPVEAEIGELVHLTLTGTHTSWKMPTEDNYIVDEHNAIVTFREPGEYTIIASALEGDHTSIVAHTIMVEGPPVPDPVQPHEPVPVTPVEPTVTLTGEVYDWCKNSDAPKTKCEILGRNFMNAAVQSSTIEEILTNVAASNRKSNQKGCETVLAQIQQYLFDNLSGDGYNQHRDAFNEIGTGLLKWSEES